MVPAWPLPVAVIGWRPARSIRVSFSDASASVAVHDHAAADDGFGVVNADVLAAL